MIPQLNLCDKFWIKSSVTSMFFAKVSLNSDIRIYGYNGTSKVVTSMWRQYPGIWMPFVNVLLPNHLAEARHVSRYLAGILKPNFLSDWLPCKITHVWLINQSHQSGNQAKVFFIPSTQQEGEEEERFEGSMCLNWVHLKTSMSQNQRLCQIFIDESRPGVANSPQM